MNFTLILAMTSFLYMYAPSPIGPYPQVIIYVCNNLIYLYTCMYAWVPVYLDSQRTYKLTESLCILAFLFTAESISNFLVQVLQPHIAQVNVAYGQWLISTSNTQVYCF